MCVPERSSRYSVTVGEFFQRRASRFTGIQYIQRGSRNHRTVSPRRPAPRRSTTTNKPPVCLSGRLAPLAERYFVFFSFFFSSFLFFVLFRFYARRYRSITEYRYANTFSAFGPRILQPSDDIFVSRPSRRRVVRVSFVELKRQEKASMRRCRIFLVFFLNDNICFFVLFCYSQSTFIEPESTPGVYTLVWNHINAHIIQ